MKKILTIASAAIVVVLAIPAVVGQYIKYQIPSQLNEQVWPNGYRAHVTNFSSGWFTSSADVIVTRGPYVVQSTSQIQYPLKLTFYHGPLIFTKNLAGNTQFFSKLAVMKGQLAVKDLSLDFIGLVGFSGGANLSFSHSNYHYTDPSGVTATIAKIDSSTDVNSAWNEISGAVTIEKLQVSEKSMNLDIPSIRVSYDMNKPSKALWLGQRQFTVPSVVFSTGNKPQLTIKQVELSGNAVLKDNLVNGEGKLQIQQIQYLNQETVGPVTWIFNSNRYAPNKVEQFSESLAAMQWDEKNPMQAEKNFQDLMRQLISLMPGTQHATKLLAVTKQGNLQIDGDFTFPAQVQAIPQTSFEADFANLMTNAVANVKLTIAIPLVNEILKQIGNSQEQAQTMLNSLQNAGALKIENGNMLSELHYQTGVVTINGIPVQQITDKMKASAAESPALPSKGTPGAHSNEHPSTASEQEHQEATEAAPHDAAVAGEEHHEDEANSDSAHQATPSAEGNKIVPKVEKAPTQASEAQEKAKTEEGIASQHQDSKVSEEKTDQ